MRPTAARALFPAWADCTGAVVGWGTYMALVAVYCVLHTAIVQVAPVDLSNSVVWPVREWGMWLLLTPPLCAGLRAVRAATPDRATAACRYAMLCAVVLAAALACRVGLDVVEGADLASSLVHFLPRHAAALALVVLAWQLWGARAGVEAASSGGPDGAAGPLPTPATLLVSQGRHERLIRVAEIDVVSAAGNYVDIRCGADVFLLRSSLRQIEQALPPGQFVRVHRSHLVNLDSLQHVVRSPAGNGSVVVRGGHAVPMSKKYRSLLKASCSVSANDG